VIETEPRNPRRPADQQLCGFARCRQPLPPPGPRGGRPYEFCPERTWPGGRSCKQLANAVDALQEAIGDAGDTAALAGATDEFGTRVENLLGPLHELVAALGTVRGRVESELTDATRRAEEAHERAAEDNGLRHRAEQVAEEARHAEEEARRREADAVALAEEHQRHREESEALCAAAVAQAKDAELARARAEADARAERDRASAAEQRAQAERVMAERSADGAATARRGEATAAAERDAAHAAAATAQETARTTEDRLSRQLAEARADALADRERLTETNQRLHAMEAAHHAEVGELREQLWAARAQAAQSAAVADEHRAVVELLRGLLPTAPPAASASGSTATTPPATPSAAAPAPPVPDKS